MTAFGIIGFGAYVPRSRMSRQAIFDAIGWAQPSLKSFARGARAFAEWDEDAITMSVEAARRALRWSSATPAVVSFASTTASFIDRQNAGIVTAALDLPARTQSYDVSGSQRAGLSAVIAAAKDQTSTTLVVAADRRPVKAASTLEMLSGDAGAALLLGHGETVAEILGTSSITSDLVDHYRTNASGVDHSFEERWFREAGIGPMTRFAVSPLLEKAGVKPSDIDHLIAPLVNPALARAVADAAGISPDRISDSLYDNCGHAGAAHPLLMLASVLERASRGALILTTAFGQGCDALLLRVSKVEANDKETSTKEQIDNGALEKNYARFLAAGGRIDLDWGMRAERDNRTAQTVAYNKSRDIYGFVGGRCAACGTPQFPRSRRCVNPECAALDTQEDYRFAERRAHIKSFTEDWLAFTRSPPLVYGNVAFEGGGNVFIEMTGFSPGEAAIGREVEMKFRIKDIDVQRGFHRYFWKAAPSGGGDNG
jgi:3-hydroxy-3-methylglutaryl CoA synthase